MDGTGTVAEAAAVLAGRSEILIFSGAGISTESGIPDFRGPSGIWKTTDPADFTLQRYLADADFRRDSWKKRFTATTLHGAAPNPAHRAVAQLWNRGRMIGCVTQNIDGLHVAGGLPSEALAELHGNVHGIMCVRCNSRPDRPEIERRWRDGEPDPKCEACGGILKTTTVLFGEQLPEHDINRATVWAAAADAVIAVGTTLSVYPAAFIPMDVAARGKPFVIVNEGPTEMDHTATTRLDGKAGTLLPALVDALIAAG
jgi:NAD-dependent deacetylase